MARIAGVQLPEEKRIDIALTSIYGIGRIKAFKILKQAKIKPSLPSKKLSDEQIAKLQKIISTHITEGALKKIVSESIKRLKQISTYRGQRHVADLPSRGQVTRHNARTRRGKRRTVGALKKADMAKIEASKKEKAK